MLDFNMESISWTSDSIESFLTKKISKIKVKSMRELVGFNQVGKNLLVREADESFWSINKDTSGSYYLERIVGESDGEGT
jgi:ABC-type Zn2+ transport system substrate-binding protein/surface adhesin